MPWNSLQVTPKVINVVNEKHSCLLFQHHFQLFLLYIPKRYWQFFKKCNASVRSILTFQHGLPLIFSLVKELFEEVTSPSHSVVFLYFFALITEEGFLIYPCYSLGLYSNGYVFPFLLCFLPLFSSQLFVRPPQTAILLFCISSPWGRSWSLSPVQCHERPSIDISSRKSEVPREHFMQRWAQ